MYMCLCVCVVCIVQGREIVCDDQQGGKKGERKDALFLHAGEREDCEEKGWHMEQEKSAKRNQRGK